jgi:hypothetical protein
VKRQDKLPGAKTTPPELAGRDALIELAAVAHDRIRARRTARSNTLDRLRSVGKSTVLGKIGFEAEARGLATVAVGSPEERSFTALLSQPWPLP